MSHIKDLRHGGTVRKTKFKLQLIFDKHFTTLIKTTKLKLLFSHNHVCVILIDLLLLIQLFLEHVSCNKVKHKCGCLLKTNKKKAGDSPCSDWTGATGFSHAKKGSTTTPLCSLTVTYSDPGGKIKITIHTAPYKQECTNPFHNSHAGIRDQKDSCHKKSSHALRLPWEDPQPLDDTWCKGSGRQRIKRQLCSCLALLYSALRHIVLWQQSSLQLVLLKLKTVPKCYLNGQVHQHKE